MSEKQLLISEPTSIYSTHYQYDGEERERIALTTLTTKAWNDGKDPLVQIHAQGFRGEVQIDLSIEDAKTIREWLDKAIFDAVKIQNQIEDEKRKAAKLAKEGGEK